MLWAITNGTYIFQDILKTWFDIYLPSHIDQGTKFRYTSVLKVSITKLYYCAILYCNQVCLLSSVLRKKCNIFTFSSRVGYLLDMAKCLCVFLPLLIIQSLKVKDCRSQWPRDLRCRSAASRLLRLWVRIPLGTWLSVVSVLCCQVEVSATCRSLVQRSPTDCGASSCVI